LLEQLHNFLQTRNGKIVSGILIGLGVLSIIMSVRTSFSSSDAVAQSRDRIYICAETGKTFRVELKAGMATPIESPYSGKATGYPPELCYWTAGGSVKKEPTFVVMKKMKGEKGPTFCPDCHRRVVNDNPVARAGATPPKLESEDKPSPQSGLIDADE